MMHHLAVAVRALDPPGGGAERSLSSLLSGISTGGQGFDSSATYSPLHPTPPLTSQLMQPWKVSALYSTDGGEQTNLLTDEIQTSRIELTSESFLSGLAWRLRSRRSGHPNSFFLKKHLRKINLEFYQKTSSWLDKFEILPTLGVTQLEWSAGAAQAFRERNIPYLLFVRDDIILSTEHGPKGGDEVNINNIPLSKIKNFGWPISSYGEHYKKNYSEKILKEAPLNKSHKKFGFEEPIKYFNPSIGISQVISLNQMDTEFLVGAMGNEVIEQDLGLHYIKLSDNRNKVINHNYITLNERVRDIIISEDRKLIVIFLETSSSIAVLNKINN
mgnify:CR=1 FL=1